MSPRFVFTFLRLLAAVVPLAICSGCLTVSVYQPLTGLQRPVVVDPAMEGNFSGTKILIYCVPSEALTDGDATLLCRRLRTLFGNQGATVETQIPRGNRSEKSDEDSFKPDMVLVLKSRLVHEEDRALLRALCVISFTLIPSMDERTYATDISIRDANGALLAADVLQARFITYYGVGVWGVNWLADVLVREPDQEVVIGDPGTKDFSRDFYGQLSQTMFNAKIRQQVLSGFPAPVKQTGPVGQQ